MKTFKLKKISYQNIMSVGSAPIVIQLDKCLKTLITGTNGTGKSTMLEAIVFALFGQSFRDIKKAQLINTVNGKKLLVELWLEYNEDEFYIKRGQKPTIFEVYKNGELLDAVASTKDFQAEFENMIGMSYNSFKQVVVLGTAGYTPFMGLTAPNRRKLVEDLLEVSILAEMDKLNKSEIKQLTADLNANEMEMNHIKDAIKTHKDYAEKQAKMSGDNIARLEKMYDDSYKEVQSLKAKNMEVKSQKELIILPDGHETIHERISDASRKHTAFETVLNSKNRVISLYAKGGNCPTCTQVLDNQSALDVVKSDAVELKNKYDEFYAIETELLNERKKVEDLQSELRKLNQMMSSNKEVAVNLVDRLKKIRNAINEAQKETVDNSDEIKLCEANLDLCMKKKTSIFEERHGRMVINEMLKDSGVKASIIKRYIPLFNQQINHYLNIMEADYSFNLNEEFTETIRSRGRENFSYASFSQGEKARIDLALLFTWRDVAEQISGIKINYLFLDEVADGSTDAQGVKTIQQILNSLEDTNVFIISHRDHNPQDYGQHLQMKKVGRFTVMEQD